MRRHFLPQTIKQIKIVLMTVLPIFTILHFDGDFLVNLPSLGLLFALRFVGRCDREAPEETKSRHQEPMALR